MKAIFSISNLLAGAAAASLGAPAQLRASNRVEIVYRGDPRPPSELRQLGGIATEYGERPFTNDSFGLEAHHRNLGRLGNFMSVYTSTSRWFGVTEPYATNFRESDGWIYRIRATPNMIDMVDSGFRITHGNESEFSAMGGIRWDQIQGWTPAFEKDLRVTSENMTKEDVIFDTCRVFKTRKASWIANVEYNHVYDQYSASGGQPQLAGDSPEQTRQRNKTLEEHGLEFMRRNGGPVGWDGKNGPFLTLVPPQRPWKGPFPLDADEVAPLGRLNVTLCDDPPTWD
ncbi:putative enterotoxin [Ophiocordyceps unilateralis]|uniref:Enterotoxin n=1 Tax=Ophiocordyceps unilateralis TaxID=268505 RepID=A0A2A9PJL7_OPHUN|nr:putative enterotoxin [Ophiocordyceps unilateralis]